MGFINHIDNSHCPWYLQNFVLDFMKQLLMELRKALAFDSKDYNGIRIRAWTDNDDIRASTSLEPTNATLFIDEDDGL